MRLKSRRAALVWWAHDRMKVLLVEDTFDLGDAIVSRIRAEGHAVEWLVDGNEALQRLQHEAFDVIILDLMLPGAGGAIILKDLRRRQLATPVLVVTARNEIDEKIDLLDIGADDYLIKPFDLRELDARMRAVARRQGNCPASSIEIGDVQMDVATRSLTVAGRQIDIGRREFRLLELLVYRQGQVVQKERLMDQLFGSDGEVCPNALELYISRLRKKLSLSALRVDTVRGVGYIAKRVEVRT